MHSGPWSVDSPHRHAEMLGLKFDYHHSGLQDQGEGVCHLGGEPLLDLRARRRNLQGTAQLAGPGDLPLGQVSHPGLSEEGQQVMLTHRMEGQLGYGHRVVSLGLKNGIDRLFDPGPDTGKERLVHPGHPGRRLLQSLPAGILADALQDLRNGPLNAVFLDRDSLLFRPDSLCASGLGYNSAAASTASRVGSTTIV